MAFDGLFTKVMVEELNEALTGGRVNKIHQPYKNETIMVIRARGKNNKLLISAHPSYARVQLTETVQDNPSEPPLFCIMMRKHLDGAILENIRQFGLDRTIVFEFKGKNEIGDISYKDLYVEIMGRHSNILLVDKEKGTIIDSIKHVPSSMNSYRTILPGAEYVEPPAQHKQNPLIADSEQVTRAVDFNAGKIAKQLVSAFEGLSPLISNEIVSHAGLANRETVPSAFLQVMAPLSKGAYSPVMIDSGDKTYFYMIDLPHIQGERTYLKTVSSLLDRYYFGKAERDRVRQQANDLERLIGNELQKNRSKIHKLERTLAEAENAGEYQRLGELLTANLYAVKKGMKEIDVINYYDENGATVTITLDPQKNPADNAQKYFSRYQKAKHAVIVVQEQIEKTKDEIRYFEALLQQLESASPRDIEEIREELAEEGYIKARHIKKKKKAAVPAIEEYVSTDGTVIHAGKNNRQNDYLTNKVARRDDIWLHTKDIPGSHVVIRSDDPSEETMLEAAMIAAYYSKAKDSSSVPVDYTKVRYVKKPSGAKPGFVIYDNQHTVYVTPDEGQVMAMKK
ncbi:NFACT family protein [Domibacillus sp. A3M-37]|uniref:Rqc2 family fibronectin-binding protein n=1 Tax=Domibacillus TaxID=1433999 RepID=UPI000617DB0C|nr:MULTISPECIES: NFACT RNA binding domain-containing protein [Domibacillus]MCP3761937.1 NFACT family protein [Domibacillus sp. A3M-37]